MVLEPIIETVDPLVTVALVPESPVKSKVYVPATLGKVIKSPCPFTYCEEVPCQTPVIVPEVVIVFEATFKAVPSVLKFIDVTPDTTDANA